MVKNFKWDESVSSSLLRIPCSSLNVNNKYFFGLNRLSACLFFPMYTWLLYPGNVKLISLRHKNESSFSLISSVMIAGRPIFCLFGSCIFDQAENNCIFLGVAWIESSNKAFAITHSCAGSFDNLLFALCRLLEKAGKAVFTIVGQSVLTTRVSFVVLLLKI